jgi:preprotein translocase subunit SecD
MFKTDSSKLILVTVISTIALLIALPRIELKYYGKYFNIDTFLGGYIINIPFTNYLIDLSDYKKGLDIEGGVKVVINLDMNSIPESERDSSAESVKEIINRRINFLGVAETTSYITRSNNQYRLIIEIPGQKNLESAIQSIGSTAQLSFKVIKKGIEFPIKNPDPNLRVEDVFEDSPVTGKDLIGSEVIFDSQTNNPVIQLRFSNEGRKKFSEVVKQNIEKPIGIFLDDKLLQAPVVSKDLASGLTNDPTITGFDLETAKNVSSLLKAGALPVPIEIVEQSYIGATLGTETVNRSLSAGIIGLVIVSLFLIVSYRNLGIIAVLSLIIYISFALSIFKILNVVLTLPGIAGFIFSIGVACDALILIFERIKEEIRWGKSSQLAIHNGYQRAWSSIKDSNLTTLLVSLILIQFGTGFVKGFGVTLSIGILVSLFTSVYVSHLMVKIFIREVKIK